MLVLTRRIGESVYIFPSDELDPKMAISDLFREGPIKITLTRVNGNQSRLGIIAPETLTIAREEVVDQLGKLALHS
jgi:sRNA-binding carbon storage regulator CsrA